MNRKLLNVILADDHDIVRRGLMSVLSVFDDVRVIADVSNGESVLRVLETTPADLVIMDVAMPGMGGAAATQALRARYPEVRVLALSMHADRRFVDEMLRAGACGYVLKNQSAQELRSAIDAVMSGGIYLSSALLPPTVDATAASLGAGPLTRLSERERDVLRGFADGKSTKEVAFDLGLSAKTVETYRERIRRKLKVDSVAEMTKLAIREGLVEF